MDPFHVHRREGRIPSPPDHPGAAFMFSVGSHNRENLTQGTSLPCVGLQTYLRASSLPWTGAGPTPT